MLFGLTESKINIWSLQTTSFKPIKKLACFCIYRLWAYKKVRITSFFFAYRTSFQAFCQYENRAFVRLLDVISSILSIR